MIIIIIVIVIIFIFKFSIIISLDWIRLADCMILIRKSLPNGLRARVRVSK